MTRGEKDDIDGDDYLERVERVMHYGAEVYVSLHINSAVASSANGVEVYVPSKSGSEHTQVSAELADKVIANLEALGLYSRGVKVNDGLAVINQSNSAGIPGILIEHGFISNAGDATYYLSDEGCRRLGQADADAIARQFPQSAWVDYSAVYDFNYYLEYNSDVRDHYGSDDPEGALGHFLTYGMGEGRKAIASFDVDFYRQNYDDLRSVFGNDLRKYYLHYVEYGQQEGRVADRLLDDEPAPPVSLSATPSADRSTVVASLSGGLAASADSAVFAVWSERGGQDDIEWHWASRASDGSWRANISVADHGSYGSYDVHAYATPRGSSRLSLMGTTTFSIEAPSATVSTEGYDQKAGTFDVVLRDLKCETGVSYVEFPVWSEEGGQDDIVWHRAKLQSDGSYRATVSMADHGFSTGPYDVHAYVTDKLGILSMLSSTVQEVSLPPVSLSATPSADRSTVVASLSGGLAASADSAVFAVWSERGGQDDIEWHWASRASDGSWRANISVADHGSYGSYDVHAYATPRGSSRLSLMGTTTFSIEAPSATVSVSDINEYAGTFVVSLRNIVSTAGVKKVEFPTWSASDQSDIAWYVATRQADGSYQATVDIKNHLFVPGKSRNYSIHAYLTDRNNIRSLIDTTDVSFAYTGESAKYSIMGTSNMTASQMAAFYKSKKKAYPSNIYSNKGASSIDEFCAILVEEAQFEGVKPEVVFAQAMHETGWLQFGGDVKIDQCNFAGIGAVGNGEPGYTFESVRIGLRAQVQHLKGYASKADLNGACVDPRFGYVDRGIAPNVEDLGGRWATGTDYGYKLVDSIYELTSYTSTPLAITVSNITARFDAADEAASLLVPQFKDGVQFLFFPSGVDMSKVSLDFDTDVSVFASVCTFGNDKGDISIEKGEPFNLGAIINASSNEVSYIVLTVGNEGAEGKVLLGCMQDSGVMSLHLTSDDASAFGRDYVDGSSDHSAKATGKMVLLGEGLDVRYSGKLTQIKGRGNSTWAFTDKKSYQIKLDKKASLIFPEASGEKSKTWLLLANPFDPTLIRNNMTYSLAKELGLSGSPDSIPIDLYYDGEYRGSYLLCEKVAIGSGRVEINDLEGDIEKANPNVDDFDDLGVSTDLNRYGNEMQWVEGLADPDDISGGYLLELDDAYYRLEKSYFRTSDGSAFVSKSPEYLSRNQMTYISEFVEEVIQCVKNGGVNKETGKGLFEYIDKDSFTKYFFVQDWSKNADSFISSTYFYKPAGEDKLYAGPIWDCDASFGIRSDVSIFSSPQGWLSRGFAKDLIEVSLFRKALRETYEQEIRPSLYSTLLGTTNGLYVKPFGSYISQLAYSSSMNYVLWEFDDCMGTFFPAASYWENVDNMFSWITSRSAWIDDEILDESFTGSVSASTGLGYGAVYDAAYYGKNNPDVVDACGEGNSEGIFEHFIHFGMAEGRRANETFDVFRYRTSYADLRSAFGDDLKAYYEHYIEYGQFEGRSA